MRWDCFVREAYTSRFGDIDLICGAQLAKHASRVLGNMDVGKYLFLFLWRTFGIDGTNLFCSTTLDMTILVEMFQTIS